MHAHEIHPALPAWHHALNDRLSTFFADEHPALHEATAAIVAAEGKRLRPAMLLLSCDAVGHVDERALTYAALVELIHTASLVHDDVVDEAELRRGMPAIHMRWGNKIAILLGDLIIARLFSTAVADGDLTLLRILADAATAMVRGVALEVSGLTLEAEEATYWAVVAGKTASLFAAAAAAGAHLGGATPALRETARQMGEAFGYAFQVADDLLDLQGSEADAGKSLEVDWRQRRATLPLLVALRTAPEAAAAEMRALWRGEPFTHEQLTALRDLVEAHGGFDYARQKVKEYLDKACAHLHDLPASAGRDALTRLCEATFPVEAPLRP